jgi:hydroxymethylbilane synthase
VSERTRIRIGTRGSDLALWQARHVAERLGRVGFECELVVLKTRGDLIDDVPLTQVEGKAFFTAEIERALLAGEVDLAVHSHKDLPTESTPGLAIAAVPARGPRGERLLIAPHAHAADAALLPLARGARVGTSAPRRAEQLRTLRPDLTVLDLRGNVPTRVRKLRDGQYDAIVLAAAGLDRLQLPTDGLVAIDLPLELFVPAPAQGALALQVREGDERLFRLCRDHLHDQDTARAIAAERSLLSSAGGGCNLPVAATLARGDGRAWLAHAFLGAGHPAGAAFGRWACAEGPEPESAVLLALESLRGGGATGVGPLSALRVALTGSASDGSVLGERLAALGARVVEERAIELEPIDGVDLAARLAELRQGDALVVTSRYAARRLAGHRVAPGVTIAAVGRACARALAEGGLEPQIVGEGGGEALARKLDVAPGRAVLWPCAEEAAPDLADALQARGIEVRRLPVYRTRLVKGFQLARDVDVRVYMSPSAVEASLASERALPSAARRFALGHATAAALVEAGLEAASPSCASAPITDELVTELVRLVSNRTPSRIVK